MGDRGNIIVKDRESKVFLYTHWTGSELPGVIARGLAKGKSRWDDGPYLARVLFQEMVGGDSGVTGFGISSTEGDGGTDITVDLDTQTVIYRGNAVAFSDYDGKSADEDDA